MTNWLDEIEERAEKLKHEAWATVPYSVRDKVREDIPRMVKRVRELEDLCRKVSLLRESMMECNDYQPGVCNGKRCVDCVAHEARALLKGGDDE